jgi:hypothetical protein
VYSDFYEIPLPALRFEKVEETHREVNDTEEKDARPRQKYKQKEKRHERTTYDAHRQQRNAESTTSKRHTRNTHASKNNKTQTEKERQ